MVGLFDVILHCNEVLLFVICVAEIAEFKRQSHSVQRDLPRPSDVNMSVLRPQDMYPDLNAYQVVCPLYQSLTISAQ